MQVQIPACCFLIVLLSVGYLAFFVQICINGIVLGTWSFSEAGAAVPFIDRITCIFDLAHMVGLWEMTGQLFVTCAVAHITTILTSGKNTVTRKFKDIHLTSSARVVLIIGFALMSVGAIVESIAINTY